MSNESYLLLITYYFDREVRALGEFNLPSSIPSFKSEKCGFSFKAIAMPMLPDWGLLKHN
ncbi:MAG: hypothetical protein ACYTXE_06310 [Nostoc sp.]|uniref:hypothetical protein n=1 Tax=Nostoc sp. TaxID=1180 RepID=UPI002FF82D37